VSGYSDKVRQLVAKLPRRGELAEGTNQGEASNPVCGDVTRLFLLVQDGQLNRVRFQARGCPAALAGAAGLAEMTEGLSVDQALQVSTDDLLQHLDGLPSHKRHGAEMAVAALRQALS